VAERHLLAASGLDNLEHGLVRHHQRQYVP
jgi:hypothetical protein